MRNITAYLGAKKRLVAKFILVSGSAVFLNLLLLYLMVRYLGFNTALKENIANVISMEVSIIYNFFLSRAITWNDRHKEHGARLFLQLIKFQAAIGITSLMRVGLFALLQSLGVFYLLNAAIGIAIAASVNFVTYDTLVFKRRG